VNDFVTALGLVLVLEGIVYGGMPAFAKRLAAEMMSLSEAVLRAGGLVAIVIGVGLVWLVRG